MSDLYSRLAKQMGMEAPEQEEDEEQSFTPSAPQSPAASDFYSRLQGAITPKALGSRPPDTQSPRQEAMGDLQVADDTPWYEQEDPVDVLSERATGFFDKYVEDGDYRDDVHRRTAEYFDPRKFKDQNFIENFGKRLKGGGRLAEGAMYSLLAQVQDGMGDKEDSDFWWNKYQGAMQKKAALRTEVESLDDVKSFADLVMFGSGAAVEAIPVMGPGIAAGALVSIATAGTGTAPWVAGYLGAIAPSAAMEIGFTGAETKEKTGDFAQGKDFLFGFMAGSLDSIGAGRIGGKLGKKTVMEMVEQASKRGVAPVSKRIAKNMTKQFFAEGVPEAMQEVIEKMPGRIEAGESIFQPGDIDMMKEAFAQGGAAGMILGGGGQVVAESRPGKNMAKVEKLMEQGVTKWLNSQIEESKAQVARPGDEKVGGATMGDILPELEGVREKLGAEAKDPFDLMNKLHEQGALKKSGDEVKAEIAKEAAEDLSSGKISLEDFNALPSVIKSEVAKQAGVQMPKEEAPAVTEKAAPKEPPSEGQKAPLEATEGVEPTEGPYEAQITPEERVEQAEDVRDKSFAEMSAESDAIQKRIDDLHDELDAKGVPFEEHETKSPELAGLYKQRIDVDTKAAQKGYDGAKAIVESEFEGAPSENLYSSVKSVLSEVYSLTDKPVGGVYMMSKYTSQALSDPKGTIRKLAQKLAPMVLAQKNPRADFWATMESSYSGLTAKEKEAILKEAVAKAERIHGRMTSFFLEEKQVAAPAEVAPEVVEEVAPETAPAPSEQIQSIGVEEAGLEAGKHVDDSIEEMAPQEGLQSSIAGVFPDMRSKRKPQKDVASPPGEAAPVDRPEVRERKESARGLSRREEGNVFSRAWNDVKRRALNLREDWGRTFFRKYSDLDTRNERHAQVNDSLRRLEAVPSYAKGMAINIIKGNIAGLQGDAYRLYEDAILMPDLLQDIERGLYNKDDGTLKEIPWGYRDKQEVAEVTQKIVDRINTPGNEAIKEAVGRRNKFMHSLRESLIANGLLDESVRDKPHYFHHQVLEMMADRRAGVTKGRGVRTGKMGWQRARKGFSGDYNTEYIESEMEVISQAYQQLKAKEILGELRDISDITPELKAKAKKEGKALKDMPLPDGYTRWYPRKGNLFYKTLSITDKKLQKMLDGEIDLDAEQFSTVLALGKRRSWVVPKEIADTLESMEEMKTEEGLSKAAASLQNTWKQWVLLNPLRILKYNINNMSGDLDIALAYDPRMLKGFWKNSKLLYGYNVKGKSMTPLLRDALELAVIDTGMTINDIADVSEEGVFKMFAGETDQNWLRRYWKSAKGHTVWRENVLRLTAYEYFLKRIEAGENPMGASKAHEVVAIKDPKHRAAKLARELVGDYGNLSKGGQWLRRHAIPFYSWMEINAPRYVRMFANVRHEGRGSPAARVAGVASKKAVLGTARLTAQAMILAGAVQTWNRTFFPDEDDELKEDQRHQMHLILGRTSDGRIRTLRFQGALSDALSWFGGDTAIQDVKDIKAGKKTVREQAEDMAQAPVQRILDGSVPLLKAPFESLAGKSFWPDFRNPRTVRSGTEHLARMWSLDAIFRTLSGHPDRGWQEETLKAGLYYRNPQEAAYDITRRKVWRWMEVNDIPSYYPEAKRGSTAWKKSNALYLYRKSLRMKDQKSAERWIGEYEKHARKIYEDQGLSEKEIQKRLKTSLDKSYKRAHPLGSLNKKDQKAFLDSLTEAEMQTLRVAEDWFGSTYGHMGKTKKKKRIY